MYFLFKIYEDAGVCCCCAIKFFIFNLDFFPHFTPGLNVNIKHTRIRTVEPGRTRNHIRPAQRDLRLPVRSADGVIAQVTGSPTGHAGVPFNWKTIRTRAELVPIGRTWPSGARSQ